MSKLLIEQQEFAFMVSDLIRYAYSIGYKLTFGDAYASSGHMNNSKHYSRRAIDLNIFKGDVYLIDTKDHQLLGEYWEQMGGIWGGRWGDGNHYEI